jgi:hypothetical protein
VPKALAHDFIAFMGVAFGAGNVFPLHIRHHGVVCIERI